MAKVKIKVNMKGVVVATLAAASLNCSQLAHDLEVFDVDIDDSLLDLINDLRRAITGLAKLIPARED